MYVVLGTRKFLERVGAPSPADVGDSTTVLGDWYATVLFWKPQVGLFVNESTLLPVLLPFAPAATVVVRFPAALAMVLRRHGIGEAFIAAECEAMIDHRLAKTRDRSVVGMMTEFAFLAAVYAEAEGAVDLVELSLRLARTPCGPWPAARAARTASWPPMSPGDAADGGTALASHDWVGATSATGWSYDLGDSPTSEEGPWLTGLSCCMPTMGCRSSPTRAR